jgi:DNA modification methylase
VIADDLAHLLVPLDRLDTLPGNPRHGDVDAVVRSYSKFGQRKPIVARHRDGGRGEVTAGNTQLAAARQLGWDSIAVVWVDDDDVTAKAWALADNRTSDLGSYDEAALAAFLEEVQAMGDDELFAATAYTEADLAELLAGLDKGLSDPDDVPALPAEPITEPGDVWLFGLHRVMCGDSTEAVALERLMAGQQAALVWADPPYGVSYVGKTRDSLTIENDGQEGLEKLLRDAFSNVDLVLEPGARLYVAHPAGALSRVFVNVVGDLWHIHETLIWVKDVMVMGQADYHYKHEPLLYAYKKGVGRWGRGGQGWYGGNSQVSVFEVPRPARSAEHPTMKPVQLIERCLLNSSAPGQVVLDPFGGSGSTLIAAHATGRLGRLMEIDPRYVDITCRRWQGYTGRLPVLERTGEPVDFGLFGPVTPARA